MFQGFTQTPPLSIGQGTKTLDGVGPRFAVELRVAARAAAGQGWVVVSPLHGCETRRLLPPCRFQGV